MKKKSTSKKSRTDRTRLRVMIRRWKALARVKKCRDIIFLLGFCMSCAATNTAIGQAATSEGDEVRRLEPIHSMGQPLKVLPYGGLSLGTFGSDHDFAGYGSFGIYKDIVNPALSAVGFSLEGYVGGRTEELDGGFRALIGSRILRIGGGIDSTKAVPEQ